MGERAPRIHLAVKGQPLCGCHRRWSSCDITSVKCEGDQCATCQFATRCLDRMVADCANCLRIWLKRCRTPAGLSALTSKEQNNG